MRDELRADLILAQEVSGAGIPPQVLSEWLVISGEKGRFRKNWNWGSVIAAHPSFQLKERNESYGDPWLAQLYDLVLVADIQISSLATITVASVHTAAMRAQDWLQQHVKTLTVTNEEMTKLRRPDCIEDPYINDFAFHALERQLRGRRFFVAGDWNTCRKYAGGTNFFDRASKSGWIDCHGCEEAPSYFGRNEPIYQLDHAFCDPITAAAQTSAAVISNDLVKSLSDHAPIVVDLQFANVTSPAGGF